jgi:hypothetical protein
LGSFLKTGNSLRDPAAKAYDQVFAPHHSWTIHKAIGAGMFCCLQSHSFLRNSMRKVCVSNMMLSNKITGTVFPSIKFPPDMFLYTRP